jgi:hypothetical protein
VSAPGDNDDGRIGGMMIGKGNRSTQRKPAPVPLCPPQTPHAARTRTRVAAVESQRQVFVPTNVYVPLFMRCFCAYWRFFGALLLMLITDIKWKRINFKNLFLTQQITVLNKELGIPILQHARDNLKIVLLNLNILCGPLATLWASMAWNRDIFTFYFTLLQNE